MIKLGPDDLNRMNWYGAKRAVAKLLALPGVNQLVQFAARKMLPADIAQRLPLARSSAIYRLESGDELKLNDPIHDIVARDIHWGGAKPTSPAEARKLICIERLAHKATVFLDVGAYGGVCALIAAHSNPRLHAIVYEIVPENYLLVIRNIVTNNLAARVEAKLLGIGAGPEVLRLPAAMKLASFATSISLGSSFEHGIDIRVVSLDQETAAMSGPFLMKIDVEGYEQQVFDGGVEFIRKHRPDIICEVLTDAGEACLAIERQLAPLGYRYFAFKKRGTIEADHIAPDAVPRDWLFSARDDIESFL